MVQYQQRKWGMSSLSA